MMLINDSYSILTVVKVVICHISLKLIIKILIKSSLDYAHSFSSI